MSYFCFAQIMISIQSIGIENVVPRKKVVASEVSCTDKACRVHKENLDQCAIKTEKINYNFFSYILNKKINK